MNDSLDVSNLTATQQRVWFLWQLDEAAPLHVFAAAYRISGPLDLLRLEQALAAIIRRHDVLRSVVIQVERGRHMKTRAAVSYRDCIAQSPLSSAGKRRFWADVKDSTTISEIMKAGIL